MTNTETNTVSAINTATNKVVSTAAVGYFPFGVAVTPDGKHVYVTNVRSGSVSVIATATNTVVKTIAVENTPWGVAVNPDGKHAYVTNFDSNSVLMIATATNTVVKRIGVGKPREVATGRTPMSQIASPAALALSR